MVGDANGADRAVQEFLHERSATDVTVYCTGWHPRNNVGHWPVQVVNSKAPKGTSRYFAAADVAMASSADLGLMFWDAKNSGTLSKIIELVRIQKKCAIFVETTEAFVVVKDVPTLQSLVELMPGLARQQAENKIALSATISTIERSQGS